jgi:hypothetical protein
MPQIRTNRLFGRASDLDVSKRAGSVIKGLTGNPDLDDPPVTPTQLAALKKTFDESIVAANKGGSLATAQKEAARAAVVAALNKDASYVDINCEEDIVILRSSGFEPVSTNRAQTVLNPPVIVAAEQAQTGEVKLRVKGDRNRRAILGRVKTMDGDYGPVITFKNSRTILFDGLKAGVTHIFQLCGLGGSTGQSDWSEPVSKIAN